MDPYTESFETWNKIASLYQDRFMDLEIYNATYDFVCTSIDKADARILEIGCGPGNITKYLLSKRPDFAVFGIDIAPNMIALAKANNPTARFQVMDSREISQIKEKYDAIVCGFCLPYLSPEDSGKLVSDSYNLLNDNGLVYMSFVEGDPERSGFQAGSSGERMYFYFYNLEDLKTQFLQNKFQELQIFKTAYRKSDTQIDIHTIVTARKKTL